MAELYRRRISAVLTADTDVKLLIYRLTKFNGHLHQLADACLVKLRKRIVLEDLRVIVSVKKLTGIVT